MVGRDPAGPARPALPGLHLKSYSTQRAAGSLGIVVRALQDDLVALAADAPEGPVGVDEVEGVEGRVHELARGQHVHDGVEAEEAADHGGQGVADDDPRAAGPGLRHVGVETRAERAPATSRRNTPSSKQATATAIVSQFRKERLPLRINSDLEEHDQAARPRAAPGVGPKTKKGATSSTRWLKSTSSVMEPGGSLVEVPGEGIGVGLGLVVVDEARQVAPAGVAPKLDEAGAEHHAEDEPAQQHDHDRRGRRSAGKRTGVARAGARKTARKPVSRSRISQP